MLGFGFCSGCKLHFCGLCDVSMLSFLELLECGVLIASSEGERYEELIEEWYVLMRSLLFILH